MVKKSDRKKAAAVGEEERIILVMQQLEEEEKGDGGCGVKAALLGLLQCCSRLVEMVHLHLFCSSSRQHPPVPHVYLPLPPRPEEEEVGSLMAVAVASAVPLLCRLPGVSTVHGPPCIPSMKRLPIAVCCSRSNSSLFLVSVHILPATHSPSIAAQVFL